MTLYFKLKLWIEFIIPLLALTVVLVLYLVLLIVSKFLDWRDAHANKKQSKIK